MEKLTYNNYSAEPRVVQSRHNAYLNVQQSNLSPDLLWMSICTVDRGYTCVCVGGGEGFYVAQPIFFTQTCFIGRKQSF